jgi:methanogenic corrinoid protein MtbC1
MNAIPHQKAQAVNGSYPTVDESLIRISNIDLTHRFENELKHVHQYFDIAIEHELSQADTYYSQELNSFVQHYFESIAVALNFKNQALFQYETRWLFSVLSHHTDLDIIKKVKLRLSQAISSNISDPVKSNMLTWLTPIEPLQFKQDDAISLSIDDQSYNWSGSRERLLDLLFDLQVKKAEAYARTICAEIGDLVQIYENLLRPSLTEIGRQWELNQISVSQEHIASSSIKKLMYQLYQEAELPDPTQPPVSILVTGVQGNQHTIAAQMLSDAFELQGWHTLYPGSDLPNLEIIDLLREANVDALAVSCTLTKNLPHLTSLIRCIRETAELRSLPILVGGLPFLISPNLYQELPADGVAANSKEAVDWIRTAVSQHA